jgi:transcriptional regulator with XRE-family HTH domain
MTHSRERKSLTSRKGHSSVEEMVRSLSQDQDFTTSVIKQIKERNIIDHMMAIRASKRISQQEIADKMRCTQSRISKLESSKDNDLRLGDFAGYIDALGWKLELLLTPENWTVEDEVKYHAFCIKRLLDELAEKAQKDHAIAKEVVGFTTEVRHNICYMIQAATRPVFAALRKFAAKTPAISERGIHIESKTSQPDLISCEPSPC